MRPDVERVRVSPRWPARDETFATGWEWLDAADPLRQGLATWPTMVDPRLADDMLGATLLHVAAVAELDLLLLFTAGRDAFWLVRGVHLNTEMLEPPELVVSASDIVPRVVDAFGVSPAVALEVPLVWPGDAGRLVGWLIGLGTEGAQRANRAEAVLEQVAWVLTRALDAGSLYHVDLWGFLDRGRRARASTEPAAAAPPELPAPPAPVPPDTSPHPVDENVQFTVYRPRRIPPAVWCPVLAFAHLAEPRADAAAGTPDPVEEVQRQARQVLGDQAAAYTDTTQDSGEAIPRDGDITFVLDLPDLEVNPSRRSFRWLEDVHREEFRVRAPAALDGRTVRGALRVYLGALLVAEVALAVRVAGAAGRPVASETVADRARPYRRIFPSYSHRDEQIVRQVEVYARTLGDEYLRDVTRLRSGEVWNDRLLDFIRTADVFQLFWSRNSMASPWVRQEWEFALSLGRPHFIRPTYWEVPMPEAPEHDLPPATLRALHFQRLPVEPEKPALGSIGHQTEGIRGPGIDLDTDVGTDPDPTVTLRHDPVPAPRAEPGVASAPAPGIPPAAPSAPPRRRRLRLPTAVAALFFVGVVGGTLMWRQVRLGIPPPGAEQPATLQAVSPDGMVTATMDAAGRIRIASRAGGDPLVIATRFRPPDVAAMRFSADGGRIVCELRDGTTVEWDARTGTRVASTRPPVAGSVTVTPTA